MRSPAVHIHKRKRGIVKNSPYPHPDPRVQFLDKLILVVAVLYPLMTLPQIYKIWTTHDASGVSLPTWVLYTVFTIPFLIYGIVHKEKPLIIMYSLWLLVYIGVLGGIILYG